MRKNPLLGSLTALLAFFLLGQMVQGQEKPAAKADTISLLDAKRVIEYLAIPKSQQDSVKAKIFQIQKIVDEQKAVRADMMARFLSEGSRPSMETMQTLRAEMDERQKRIDALAEEIQKKLTEKQKEKFKSLVVPNLREMARAERAQWRGRGER